MPLPGNDIDFTAAPPALAIPTDPGVGYVVGLAEVEAQGLCRSIDQVVELVGPREPTSYIYDHADVFFREGGSKLYLSTVGLSGLDADIVGALDFFDDVDGIGQIAAPGITSATVQEAVMAKGKKYNRCAILDGVDTATAATLVTQATGLTGHDGDHFSALFAPWDVVPGISSGTRTVPPSARIMGNIARLAAQGKSPNQPAAGALGIARYVNSLSQVGFSDSDRQTLNEAGVNLSRMKFLVPRTYGWRSLADQDTDTEWSWFNNSRLIMVIKNDLNIVCENFQFSEDDGAQINTNKFGGAITGALMKWWPGSLFGATPSQAFQVDVGPAVNTPDTLNAGELHAKVALRCSRFAEVIKIDVAKVPDNISLS